MDDSVTARFRSRPFAGRLGWLALTVAALSLGCDGEPPGAELPDGVVGEWTTGKEPYEGRSFRIKRDSVYFETVEGFYEGYPIDRVEITTEEGKLLFNVHYTSRSDREYVFSFFYEGQGPGKIRFKNRQAVPWKKASSDSAGA